MRTLLPIGASAAAVGTSPQSPASPAIVIASAKPTPITTTTINTAATSTTLPTQAPAPSSSLPLPTTPTVGEESRQPPRKKTKLASTGPGPSYLPVGRQPEDEKQAGVLSLQQRQIQRAGVLHQGYHPLEQRRAQLTAQTALPTAPSPQPQLQHQQQQPTIHSSNPPSAVPSRIQRGRRSTSQPQAVLQRWSQHHHQSSSQPNLPTNHGHHPRGLERPPQNTDSRLTNHAQSAIPPSENSFRDETYFRRKLTSRIHSTLRFDHNRAIYPDYQTPFTSFSDAFSRLLPFHIFQAPDSGDEECPCGDPSHLSREGCEKRLWTQARDILIRARAIQESIRREKGKSIPPQNDPLVIFAESLVYEDSGDPLTDLCESSDENDDQLIRRASVSQRVPQGLPRTGAVVAPRWEVPSSSVASSQALSTQQVAVGNFSLPQPSALSTTGSATGTTQAVARPALPPPVVTIPRPQSLMLQQQQQKGKLQQRQQQRQPQIIQRRQRSPNEQQQQADANQPQEAPGHANRTSVTIRLPSRMQSSQTLAVSEALALEGMAMLVSGQSTDEKG